MRLTHWLAGWTPRQRLCGRSLRRQRRYEVALVAELLEDRTLLSTFTVNSPADTVDANPGDGVAADDDGDTTLRAAIMEANALAGPDTINLPAGTYVLSIPGSGEDAAATGDLDITDDLTISGAGPTAATTVIDAAGIDRVLHVFDGVLFTISDLTITGGVIQAPAQSGGGGILNDGAILTVSESTITANSAQTDTGNNVGGGILNDHGGTLTLLDSIVSQNSVDGGGGAVANVRGSTALIERSTLSGNSTTQNAGGAIVNYGWSTPVTFTIRDSFLLNNNSASHGGAINNTGEMLLVNTELAGNRAEGSGGAIQSGSYGEDGLATLTIQGSQIIDNVAHQWGGAVNNWSALTIQDSQLLRNTAELANGGGIVVSDYVGFDPPVVTITNSDVSDNVADSMSGGGLIVISEATVTITDSRFENNVAIFGGGVMVRSDDADLTMIRTTVSGNRAEGTLQVQLTDALDDTQTTIAVDAHWALPATRSLYLKIDDERLTVDSFDEDSETFSVTRGYGGTVAASHAEAATVIIQFPGRGGGVFSTGELLIRDSFLQSNQAAQFGGGLYIHPASSEATATVESSSISGNTAFSGGGVMNSGTLRIERSLIDSNRAAGTGGIGGIGAGIVSGGVLTVIDSTVSNNEADFYSGGIQNNGYIVTISGSTISGNSAGSGVGGIFNRGGDRATMTITNSTISGNTASGGGGIRNGDSADDESVLSMANVTVTGNIATGNAGGVFSVSAGPDTLSIQNTIIAGNSAATNPDVGGLPAFTSLGNNLIGDMGSASGFTDGVNGDIVGTSGSPVDPQLGPLQNNGGPVATHNLLSGSPAIDAGSNDGIASTDQRGIPRRLSNSGSESPIADIGSVEYIAPFDLGPTPNVTAGWFADNDADDFFRIAPEGTNIEVTVNRNVWLRKPASELTSLTVTGSGDDDRLVIDLGGFSAGVALGRPVTFNGGGEVGTDWDTLEITNGSATSITHDFSNASDGSIHIDGNVITYTGLEPISDNLSAVDRIFSFGATPDEITVSDNGVAGDGISRISSTSSSETVDFANPSGSLTINAGAGDDTITILSLDSLFSGSLTINGQSGDDTIDASAISFAVKQNGSAGNDTLMGGSAADTLNGGSGSDSLTGGAGNDRLQGQGTSYDTLSGGPGDDTLDGGAGYDRISETADVDFTATDSSLSGLGSDTLINIQLVQLFGGSSANTIDASAFTGRGFLNGSGGDDTLSGGGWYDRIFGGSGRDLITGGGSVIDPGTGLFTYDVLRGQGGNNDTLIGGAGADKLNGGAGHDSLVGGGGDDVLIGESGNDTLDGGGGTDRLYERADVDMTLTDGSLTGGLGTDVLANLETAYLKGGPGDNNLDASGFSGDVTLIGGGGADTLRGGSGNDMINGRSGDDSLTGGDGDDTLKGMRDNDVLNGGSGNDRLDGGTQDDSISGWTGDDVLYGRSGNDILVGGVGNDSLYGASGDDKLAGDDGKIGADIPPDDDLLDGGDGSDTVRGGDGSDTFMDDPAEIDEEFEIIADWIDAV